jgi:glycosyltransferase involved in cell wall biosynthesis
MLAAFDLYVAASVQETFGLSVLEALANGLPVLYTTCPALDGIETDRAVMVTGSVEAMRAAIGAQLAQRDVARPVPAEVFAAYDIAAVAERIDDLYETILSTHPRRVRVAARRSSSLAVPSPPLAEPAEEKAVAGDDAAAVARG